jgi:DNA polymerase III sliding clamp (beta) subunit (PCNA family)
MIKIKVPKNQLVSGLQKTQKIVGQTKQDKDTFGVTLTIVKEAVKIIGASETRYIRVVVKTQETIVDNESEIDKSVSTDFRKLLDVVGGVKDNIVNLEIEDSTFRVVAERSRFTLPLKIKKIEEDVMEESDKKSVSSKDLLQILKYVQISSSGELSRPVLSSVKVMSSLEGGSLFVTTDGFRLSLVRSLSSFVDESKYVQLPISYFRDVVSGVIDVEKDVSISFSSNERCVFEQGDTYTWSKTVVGEFPPYEKVLFPEYKVSICVDRQELLAGVKSISVMSREYSNVVILNLKKDQLEIKTKKEVGGENFVTIGVISSNGLEDEQINIAFNAKYLIDFLSTVTDDTVSFRINRNDAPVLFLPGQIDHGISTENLGFRHIIMPIRISE